MLLLGLTACGLPGERPAAAFPATAPVPTAASPVRLPRVTPYVVAADEPAVAVKRAAVAYLETLFGYDRGEGTLPGARERLAAEGLPVTAARAAAPLLSPAAAGAIQVVYPQLGGLTRDQASIMAVVRLSQLRDDVLTTGTRTIDVRLARRGPAWRVIQFAALGGKAPAGGRADGLGRKVLAAKRIVLPDSARWDIRAGRVDDRVLRMMLRLARDHRISVTVLASGHPTRVFGSPSTSNHTRGRAVDIWAVDGRRVTAGGAAVRAVMETALRYGSDEVGGPVAFSTRYGGAFTDTVHEDHVHIGFKR